MIPLFTPATARKDVNKTPGDGELAKLANLNRLVENVNTIVANGIPAAAPSVTYTNVGTVDELNISFDIASNPQDTYNTGGSKTVQSYYVPSIVVEQSSETFNTFTSFTLPETVFGGYIEMNPRYLTTFSAPLLTQILIKEPTVGRSLQVGSDVLSNISLPELFYVLGDIHIYAPAATTISLPKLTYARNVSIDCDSSIGGDLTTVSLPLYNRTVEIRYASQLTSIVTGNTKCDLYLTDCPAFDTLTSSATEVHLHTNTDEVFGLSEVTTVNAPNAINFSIDAFYGSSLSLPSATTVHLNWRNAPSSVSLSCPNVTDMDIYFRDSSTTSLTMPSSIVNYSGVYITNNTSLTSLSLGAIGTIKGITDYYNGAVQIENIYLANNALNVASINAVLALLVSLDGTNGTTLYEGATVSLNGGTNAAPTGQGLIDKATLQARGCTVNTN